MNITEPLLPGTLAWLAHVPFALLLMVAISRARWSSLSGRGSHLFLGACVALMLVWTMKAGVTPGLYYHFLGATLLTLMFGWELGLIGMSLVMLGVALEQGAPWSTYSINALTEGAVPVFITYGLLRLAQRALPAHLFIYIFVNGFFAAALAVLGSALAVALVLAASGTYTLGFLGAEYLAFAPLMMFSEAWLTGMLVALLVCYRPAWIHTFRDETYLVGK